MNNQEEIIVAADIGSTKINVLVGVHGGNNEIEIVGVGESPSKGIRKGNIVDIESMTECLIKAIERAEEMADVQVNSVFVNISGSHIDCKNSLGSSPILNEGYEISDEDVEKTIASAKAISIPPERMILHVLPQAFSIDGQSGIQDPRGMSGVRLEVGVHIVTGALPMVQNVSKCLVKASLDSEGVILSGLASAQATLTSDEKDMGCVLIDMGGGTSDVVLYSEGSVRMTCSLGGGGNQISNDVAHGLRVPFNKAEEIKIKYGHVLRGALSVSDEFLIPGVLGRPAKKMATRDLASIMEARMEETFMMIRDKIEATGLREKIGSGLVITGGCANSKGLEELAARVFNIPVRIAKPRGVTGLDHLQEYSSYSTCVGLLQLGLDSRLNQKKESVQKVRVYELLSNFMKRFVPKQG